MPEQYDELTSVPLETKPPGEACEPDGLEEGRDDPLGDPLGDPVPVEKPPRASAPPPPPPPARPR
ncbi:hypothetical protein Saso_25210 [Streptomyces asoensis]|uniref:Uncharacterized protein n=1 Tax=Streptomyces asoensis TaxID=249586 RepID=A0ABQ3RYH3_9ACTN|nr:hypothetical protein GCM10010496_17800 [Streptomyces asoensis]GHI60871.1 hypothetical protein Saso_25210 [Streptomyces asoensis]